MRQLDNWITYLDDANRPLQGRLTFYKRNTTELAPIYNEVHAALAMNPIYTNIHGSTDLQIFLDDIDYTIKLEKYIGKIDMVSDQALENWREIRTFDNLYPAALKPTITSDSSKQFPNMESLRAADWRDVPVLEDDEDPLVILNGYYEQGDMPAVWFILREDNTSTDDGGSIIRVDSTHVWAMIPNHILDIRSFGVFPTEDYLLVNPRYSQIRLAFDYANSRGLDVYFPSVYETGGYYLLEGGIHLLTQTLILDEKVRISGKTGTSSVFQVKNIQSSSRSHIFVDYAGTGYISIITNTVRSSWFNNSWPIFPGTINKVILDSISVPFTFVDVYVEVENIIEGATLNFEGCHITSNRKFKDCTILFDNCGYVSDEWLHPVDGNLIRLVNNFIDLKNMSCANAYIAWKNKQNENDYGDLGEQIIDAEIVPGDNCIVLNASGVINLVGPGNIEIHNFSGTINGFSSSNSINAIDSWLTLDDGNVLNNFQLRRGSYTSTSQIQFINGLYISNANVNSPILCLGNVAHIEYSHIYRQLTCTHPILLSNIIEDSIIHHAPSASMTFSLVRNTFKAGGGHILTSEHTDTAVVGGEWIGNSSLLSGHFITIDRSNFLPNESSHTYEYYGNTGKNVIQRFNNESFSNVRMKLAGDLVAGETDLITLVSASYDGGKFTVATTLGHPWKNIRLFSIGTNLEVDVKLECINIIEPNGSSYNKYTSDYASLFSPACIRINSTLQTLPGELTSCINLEHVGGYIWNIGWWTGSMKLWTNRSTAPLAPFNNDSEWKVTISVSKNSVA